MYNTNLCLLNFYLSLCLCHSFLFWSLLKVTELKKKLTSGTMAETQLSWNDAPSQNVLIENLVCMMSNAETRQRQAKKTGRL